MSEKEFTIKIRKNERGYYFVLFGKINGKTTDRIFSNETYATYDKAGSEAITRLAQIDRVLDTLRTTS